MVLRSAAFTHKRAPLKKIAPPSPVARVPIEIMELD